NEKQTKLNQSIKILENIKISITKTRIPSDLEPDNTIYKKIEHKDSCLKRLEHLLIFVKLNKEIENLKEYEIPDYKNHERLKSNFPNDLKQELKESHQKRLDFLKYLNEIQLNNEWTREIKKKFENYKNKFNNLYENDSKILTDLINKELKLIDHYMLYVERINRIFTLEELNKIRTNEIGSDTILTPNQKLAFYDKEIPRRISEIIDIIYNKVLNEINNIKNLEDFIIDSYGHGKLTENVLALGKNEHLLKDKKISLDKIVNTFLDNSIIVLNKFYSKTNQQLQINSLKDEQTSIDAKTRDGKFYLRNFEIHLNFVKFKLNDEKTFDRTSSFHTQEMKEYINKIISIHEENSIVYYQVIINRMNASTNKEDFKDWGKKNYKMSNPVVPPVVPDEDDRLPGKADTFDTIMDDFWGLINGRKFQQETDTHTLDLVKEIWELYKIKDPMPNNLPDSIERLKVHAQQTIPFPLTGENRSLLKENIEWIKKVTAA
ncbi:14713_t:CDS:2, partial [Dentiscutata heterogama]